MINLLLRFIFLALGIQGAAFIVPGIVVPHFLGLLQVAVFLWLANETLGRLIKFLAFIPIFLSLGCLTWLINGAIFLWVGTLTYHWGLGFRVESFGSAFLGSLVTSVISGLLGWIFIRTRKPKRPDQEILSPE
ncbi:MAG: phage holin family protein [Holophagaceae bacterium]|jgi:putative membrane protein